MTTNLHLLQLESSGLVRLAQSQPELEFIFRHALVQDAAYESLLVADRTPTDLKDSFLNLPRVQDLMT